jgi:hypothetical protein
LGSATKSEDDNYGDGDLSSDGMSVRSDSPTILIPTNSRRFSIQRPADDETAPVFSGPSSIALSKAKSARGYSLSSPVKQPKFAHSLSMPMGGRNLPEVDVEENDAEENGTEEADRGRVEEGGQTGEGQEEGGRAVSPKHNVSLDLTSALNESFESVGSSDRQGASFSAVSPMRSSSLAIDLAADSNDRDSGDELDVSNMVFKVSAKPVQPDALAATLQGECEAGSEADNGLEGMTFRVQASDGSGNYAVNKCSANCLSSRVNVHV